MYIERLDLENIRTFTGGKPLVFVHPDGGQLAEIGKLLEAGRIRPVIDKVFPFDQAKEALAYLERGRARGKVVVQIK